MSSSLRLNKLQELQTLRDAGIPVPDFTTDRPAAMEWVRTARGRNAPWVYGRWLNRSQGMDIVGPGYREDGGGKHGDMERWAPAWMNREFWVKVIMINQEFRQHIQNGKAVLIGRKVCSPQSHISIFLSTRTKANGWVIDYDFSFTPTQEELQEKVRDLAKRAVKALGYPYGAVDIILPGPGSGLYVIGVKPILPPDRTSAQPSLFNELNIEKPNRDKIRDKSDLIPTFD